MRRPKINEVQLPDELDILAKDLNSILKKTTDDSLEKLLNKKDNKNIENPWINFISKKLPDDINLWSSKDFVHWFAQELQGQLNIPYIVEYSRDCSAIKKIKDQLLSVGITDQKIIKDFMSWSIKNYNRLKEDNNRFDIPVLNKFLNEFFQYVDIIDDQRSIGFDILEKMENESTDKKSAMVSLLKQFGIPLTVQFYKYKGFEVEKIIDGIKTRLYRFAEKDLLLLQNTIQNSIDFSPYPNWFAFLNWRDFFTDLIDVYKIKSMKWWRDIDYSGNPAIEYSKFNGENDD